jgi:hypothetical protein
MPDTAACMHTTVKCIQVTYMSTAYVSELMSSIVERQYVVYLASTHTYTLATQDRIDVGLM